MEISPLARAVTRPVLVIVAIALSLVLHVASPVTS